MIKCLLSLLLPLVGILQASAERIYIYPLTKRPIDMSICAMDEYGNMLPGEPVMIAPFLADTPGAKWDVFKGETGADGCLKIRGTLAGPSCPCKFRYADSDYYETCIELTELKPKTGMCVTGVVRKVGKPVNMNPYAVSISGDGYQRECYIDMVRGDLVAPAHRGVVTDAVLRVSTEMYVDPVDGKEKPAVARAVLEMLEPGGGFIKVKRFRTCYFASAREAPSDAEYRKSIDYYYCITNQSFGGTASCDIHENEFVFKACRPNQGDASKYDAFYGVAHVRQFCADMSAQRGYEWELGMSLSTSHLPNERSLEPLGWQKWPWFDAYKRKEFEESERALKEEMEKEKK